MGLFSLIRSAFGEHEAERKVPLTLLDRQDVNILTKNSGASLSNMAGIKKVSLSPAQINEQLQAIMNRTALVENYQLEAETVKTYDLIVHIERGLPGEERKLSNYYLLFNAWIRWLSDWDNYSLNLLHRRRLLGHLNQQFGVGKYKLEIYPYSGKLYSIRFEGSIPLIQLHEALDYLTDYDCKRLASCIKRQRWTDMKKLIGEYQSSQSKWKDLSLFFQQTKANPTHENRTRGRFYDLETVFSSCNQRNFGGKMPRPKVMHWSAKVNHATMGSYNVNEDILMINRGLDRSDVPAYVLDFVMYHELLHKALGVKTSGTRRMSHTKEFRDLEQRHPDYERAQAFIQKNAKRL